MRISDWSSDVCSSNLDIRAPEAGLVLTRDVEPGQIVGSGSGVLFRVAKGGEMEMLAKVSEGDLSHVADGMTARVTPVGSQQSFMGRVWQVSPVVDPESRRSEEHTSELQSLMRISYADFCLKKKKIIKDTNSET